MKHLLVLALGSSLCQVTKPLYKCDTKRCNLDGVNGDCANATEYYENYDATDNINITNLDETLGATTNVPVVIFHQNLDFRRMELTDSRATI